jgi:hypothetical protein
MKLAVKAQSSSQADLKKEDSPTIDRRTLRASNLSKRRKKSLKNHLNKKRRRRRTNLKSRHPGWMSAD